MIEVGSFIGLAAMTNSEITIKNAGIKHLGIIPDQFKRLGITIEEQNDDLFIPAQDHYEIETFMDGSIMTIADAPRIFYSGTRRNKISRAIIIRAGSSRSRTTGTNRNSRGNPGGTDKGNFKGTIC